MTNHFSCQTRTTDAVCAQAQKTTVSKRAFLDQSCSRFYIFNKPSFIEVKKSILSMILGVCGFLGVVWLYILLVHLCSASCGVECVDRRAEAFMCGIVLSCSVFFQEHTCEMNKKNYQLVSVISHLFFVSVICHLALVQNRDTFQQTPVTPSLEGSRWYKRQTDFENIHSTATKF